MLYSYFKTALRSLSRNKLYTGINAIGLAFAIAISLLIFLYIINEANFDSFHSKKDRIYHITEVTEYADATDFSGATPYPLAKAIRLEYPDLENVTQIHYNYQGMVQANDSKFDENIILFADEHFFDVFDFEVIVGNPKEDLKNPNVVFLTKSTSKKYFGDRNPIGEIIQLENLLSVKVVGILKDPPKNTHLRFSMIVSYSSFSNEYVGFNTEDWGLLISGHTYIVLPENLNPADFQVHLNNISKKYLKNTETKKTYFGLQKLTDIHFEPEYMDFSGSYAMPPKYLWIFAIIGFSIILAACINFINLATAQAIKRSLEVGVRKALGADRFSLIKQFMMETIIIAFLSLVVSFAFAEVIIPIINNLMETELSLFGSDTEYLIVYLVAIFIIVSLISGLYPAFVLSRFLPINALRNRVKILQSSSNFVRKSLVTAQFSISILLIICTIVISRQMQFFKNRDVGFTKNGIITFNIPNNSDNLLDGLSNELRKLPEVKNVSFSAVSFDNEFIESNASTSR